MSVYAAGKEPPCPTGLPGCLKVIRERSAKQCQKCYSTSRKPAQKTKQIRETATTQEITQQTTERVKTLKDLVRVCEIDLETWEIVKWEANKWEMGYTDPHKQAHALPLFQIHVSLKKRVEYLAAKDEVAQLVALAKKSITRSPALIHAPSTYSHLFVPSIPDLHVGKMAWAKETGAENYDVKIAVATFKTALSVLMERAKNFTFDKVLFPIGNDLFNSDNVANTTTHGTPQDTDGRFQKTFLHTRTMIIEAIEQLRSFAPVEVLVVPGNHDTLTVWHLGHSLEGFFNSYKDVTINNDPTLRKYAEYGANMLMFTHGNEGKKTDYPLVMATEQPAMFGRTVHREAHTGHLHKAMLDEFHGVKVRISPALCAIDAWHASKQYSQARAAEAFIYHPVEGPVTQVFYSVPKKASN